MSSKAQTSRQVEEATAQSNLGIVDAKLRQGGQVHNFDNDDRRQIGNRLR
jgi:hypothetical protein